MKYQKLILMIENMDASLAPARCEAKVRLKRNQATSLAAMGMRLHFTITIRSCRGGYTTRVSIVFSRDGVAMLMGKIKRCFEM